jgi:hypothetical protein
MGSTTLFRELQALEAEPPKLQSPDSDAAGGDQRRDRTRQAHSPSPHAVGGENCPRGSPAANDSGVWPGLIVGSSHAGSVSIVAGSHRPANSPRSNRVLNVDQA